MKNLTIILIFLTTIFFKTNAQDTSIIPEKLYSFDGFPSPSNSWWLLPAYGYSSYSKFTLSGEQTGIIKMSSITGRVDTLTKAIFDDWGGVAPCGVEVISNHKSGIIDSTGKLIVPIEYDYILPIIEGRSFAKKSGKYALINSSGKLLTQFIFDDVDGFREGLAKVIINEKVGYIDRSGKYIVQPQFNDATNFKFGFAKVFSDKWETIYKGEVYRGLRTTNVNMGYTQSIPFLINKKGVKVFTGKADDIDNIFVTENNYALISRSGYAGLIDTTGKFIVSFERQLMIVSMTKNWIVVKDQNNLGKYGILDYQGRVILKPIFWGFDSLKFNGGKLGKAWYSENKFYYIDKKCNCVEYDNVKCPEKE